MHIDDDHLYHGAALTQIAEHPAFTAINAFKDATNISRSAFRVNDDIAVYFKYATKPKPPYDEFVFTFSTDNLDEVHRIAQLVPRKTFLALVCVLARHICCLPYDQLVVLLKRRTKDVGYDEDQYTILVTLDEGKSFRAYVNKSGKKKTMLGKPIVISRNKFPNQLFE
jgi:hypothetical protein